MEEEYYIDSFSHKVWHVPSKRQGSYRYFHRLNGPAIIYKDGSEEWWAYGKKHRLDGPAVVIVNEHEEWWIAGTYIADPEKLKEWIKENNIDLKTDNGQMAVKLKWG